MGVDTRTPSFLAKFPLGKVPAFEGADGFCLAEGSAISSYIASSGPLAAQLLGADAQARARVAEWTLFTNTELVAHFTPPLLMAVYKMVPYDEGRYEASAAAFERALQRVEAEVTKDGGRRKFLVGDKLTLADLEVAAALFYAGGFLLDAEMRAAAPATVEYLRGIAALPEVVEVFGEFKPCETRLRGGA